MALKYTVILMTCMSASLLSGCTSTANESTVNESTVNESSANDTVSSNELVTTTTVASEPILIIDTANSASLDEASESEPQFDQSGIALSDDDLGQLLLTDFVVENEQFVPTTGWICADSIGQSRVYYFYQQNVLDASRSVAIERTLNANDTLSDITFFWSVEAADALLMTSVNRDADGVLLSTGRQYDMSSIRFEEVDSVQTFTADSVLRGRLVCGNFDLD